MHPITNIHGIEYLDIADSPVEAVSIDLPAAGTGDDVLFIELAGWIVGKETPVLGLQIMHGEFVLKRIGLDVDRPDVSGRFPNHHYAGRSGFRANIGLVNLPRTFDITVRAVLPGETDDDSARIRVPVAIIRGVHDNVASTYIPKRQPLVVTALGRSGTTWLMHLLSQHQAITTVSRYPYEVRAGVYWMHMLNILALPGNHAQSTAPDGFEADLFHIGHCPYFHPYYFDQFTPNTKMREYFGRDYVNRLAAFCQESIDRYYDVFDTGISGNETTYFLEKGIGGQVPHLYRNVYQSTKEIILIRDCRDMYCSSQAFNKKRGYASFGRERVKTNEEWVEILQRSYSRIIEGWRSRKGEVCLVRYEDLIMHPRDTLAKILAYLAVPHDARAIEKMIKAASKDTPEMKQHRTSGNPKDSIGRWRKQMDPETRRLFEAAFGDLLEEIGYDPNS